VITFAMMSVGRSMAMVPDYMKAKEAALRIMRLNNRQSQINPHDESGIILVCIHINCIHFNNENFIFRKMLLVMLNFMIFAFDIQLDPLFVFSKISH
jgi:hypothetical protein